jgi:uncharacterized membrane protein YgcG
MNGHHMAGGPDPYEIAYLRGGQNEVARVVMVSLVERHVLELQQPEAGVLRSLVRNSKYIGQRSARSAVRLSELEQTVYDWFAQPRAVSKVFQQSLPQQLAPYCLAFEERLQRRQLLSDRPAGFLARLFGRRVTADGRAYLTQLRDRMGAAHAPMSYALAAAVAGTAALAATPLSDLGAEFKKSQQHAAASGCAVWPGAGCGGDGGSSGGDGCGGGGGGGCGGGS